MIWAVFLCVLFGNCQECFFCGMGFFTKLLASAPLSHQPQIDSGVYLLMQQQASVDMLRAMVRTGRADATELENAERRLKELEGLAPEPETVQQVEVPKAPKIVWPQAETKYVGVQVDAVLDFARTDSANTMLLRAELMSQIDKLSRKRAEACNAMHAVPKDQDCPELMAMALAAHDELEDTWTKYRYLERKGKLPEEETQKAREVSLELLKAMDERKRYAEKRSKLKKKLADPYNHKNKKRDTWQDELDLASLEIQRLDDEIYLLKNR
jgi:hypothetical protein